MIGLPPLDCHAHIASDVTARQLARLAPAIVFAVTRSPREAEAVSLRSERRETASASRGERVTAKTIAGAKRASCLAVTSDAMCAWQSSGGRPIIQGAPWHCL